MTGKSSLESFSIGLSFKGGRTYAHSTDIYDAFWRECHDRRLIDEPRRTRFTFRRSTGKQLECRFENGSSPVATIDIETADGRVKCGFFELVDDIEGRYDYDEDGLVKQASVDVPSRSIELNVRGGFSDIEHVVALNKRLLSEVVFPDALGKWMFAQLDTQKPLVSLTARTLKVVFSEALGTKLTRSSVWADGELVGTISFSLV